MIDSSEFSEFAWGGNQNLYFAYASFGWFAAGSTEYVQKYFYLEIKKKKKKKTRKEKKN